MGNNTLETIRGTFILLLGIGLVIFVIVWSVRNAEDPARMIFKWVLTVGILVFMFKVAGNKIDQGGMTAFMGIALTLVCGLALAAIWRHSITGLAARPFEALYTGGNEPPDPHPFYSVAMAKQKKGLYQEAVAEVRKQLRRFPTDVEGHLLLAQIQAENLKDFPGAEETIDAFVAQPDHHPKNIAFALYSMADWYLVNRDIDSARRCFEKVLMLLPDTEFALTASQRIAHLADPNLTPALFEPRKFIVKEGEKSLGLRQSIANLKPPEGDPKELAAWYVHHLEQHPHDADAREKLASIYAETYDRLDLAADQLEQMIQEPNQPAKNVTRWLNQLADLQVKHGGDYETARQTLQRIVDGYPNLATAELARTRIDRLKLEFKANEKNQAVKLGSYEQNIGLKRDRSTL